MKPHKMPLFAGLILATVTGATIPLQGRVNGALGARLDDGLAAAVVSITIGLTTTVLLMLASSANRATLRTVLPRLRQRRFPRWYLLAGCSGAFMVVSQGVTVSLVGIALFTVAYVTGQTLSGVIVDRSGFGASFKHQITLTRLIGAGLTVVGVFWAVSPQFSTASDSLTLVMALLMPLAAGLMVSFQQAMNGAQAYHYGSPLPATLVNFLVGSSVLWIMWLIKVALTTPPNELPTEWWYYTAGPLGCAFILFGAVLVRAIGALLTGLGMIAGQLIGSLLLSLSFPTPGTEITIHAVLGTLLTLVAVLISTLPWKFRTCLIPPARRRRV